MSEELPELPPPPPPPPPPVPEIVIPEAPSVNPGLNRAGNQVAMNRGGFGAGINRAGDEVGMNRGGDVAADINRGSGEIRDFSGSRGDVDTGMGTATPIELADLPPPPGLASLPAPPEAAEPIPASDVASGSAADPHNFGPACTMIPATTQRRAKAAVVAAAIELEVDEQVRAVVCGQYQAYDGVVVLTDQRVVFANSRTFAPETEAMALSAVTNIKGWATKTAATLRLTGADDSDVDAPRTIVIGDIKEVRAARAFAVAVRAQIAE